MMMALILADAIAPVPANCANATIGASIRTAVAPDYPDSARTLGPGARAVLISVTVNADGTVASAVVTKSSGNVDIDAAAVRSARASTYTPTFVNCLPIDGGTFVYRAEFTGAIRAPMPAGPSFPCPNPFAEATVTRAAAPVYPESAFALHLDLIQILVGVYVSPSGAVASAQVFRSSGNIPMDMAALAAARTSSYAPKVVNCKPTTGLVIVREVFDPTAPTPSVSP